MKASVSKNRFAHSRKVSLRNDKKAWLVGRRIRHGRSSAAIKHQSRHLRGTFTPSHQVNC